jgi:hypothetical protein
VSVEANSREVARVNVIFEKAIASYPHLLGVSSASDDAGQCLLDHVHSCQT